MKKLKSLNLVKHSCLNLLSFSVCSILFISLLFTHCTTEDTENPVLQPKIDLVLENYNFTAEGGKERVKFHIENKKENHVILAKFSEDWVTSYANIYSTDEPTETSGQLIIKTEPNKIEENREGTLFIYYMDPEGYDDDIEANKEELICSCTITQEAKVIPKFTIQPKSIDMTSVTFDVEEVTNSITYCVTVEPKKDFDKKYAGRDLAYFNNILRFYKVMAGVNKMSMESYLESILHQGKIEFLEEDLYYDTDYYLCVFGLNKDSEFTTPLNLFEFKTKTFEPSEDCQFVVSKVNVDESSMEIFVGASDANVRYYVSYLTAKDIKAYDTAEDAALDVIFTAELFDDVDWSDPKNTYAGNNNIVFDSLEPKTEYHILVFGISGDGELTTKVAEKVISTL